LHRKKARDSEEDSSFDSFIFSLSKKPKNSETFFPQINENLLYNKIDKYSNST